MKHLLCYLQETSSYKLVYEESDDSEPLSGKEHAQKKKPSAGKFWNMSEGYGNII